ncbi:GNAT family N-acetyltransferase [Ferdinandcohnia quinoae]
MLSNEKMMNPVHLLIAFLQEKSGALGEMAMKCELDISTFRGAVLAMDDQTIHHSNFIDSKVTDEVEKAFEAAISYMKKYNQIHLNEGHVLRALLTTKTINNLLTDQIKNIMIALGTTARDMITHLGKYTFPDIQSSKIRKVTHDDYDLLVSFVEHRFSGEWSQTIVSGFELSEPNIYIALNDCNEIIGFAAFDTYQNKKGYFGPMGVATSKRTKGIGYSLLHHCLRDMKEIGYEYAIIGGAGPIEFYEKACNAVVIPYPIPFS